MKFSKIFDRSDENGSLVNKFATIMGTSIFITLFFIAAFNLYASIPIIKQYKLDKNESYYSITNIVTDNLIRDINKGNFENTENLAKSLLRNNLILYINVIEEKTGICSWSTIQKLLGKKVNPENSLGNEIMFSDKLSKYNDEGIKEIRNRIGKYILVTGFYDNNVLISLINVLLKGDITLVLMFIIFGFASAFILANFVTRPIKDLVNTAEEFSKGNFKHRATIITQDEIGKLANAFNDMAGKLDILYSSLEQQVKDRTNELVEKNSQLESAYHELKEAQTMLIHSEKMKSLGQFVAGVAHELNNPINFIYGNLDHLRNYTNDLIKIIDGYDSKSESLNEGDLAEVNEIKEEIDYEFLLEDLPALIKSCKDGAERCKQIVLDLKNFSRLDEAVIKEIDVHEGIESTLNILHNKFKNRITIHKDYGTVPLFSCYAGQINQVFMNILDNASQAIPDKGDVYIKTKIEDNSVIIIFEDNGVGIDKEVLSRIFDPFFTTKQVGEGTGLGLSVSYKIIKTHHGTIDATSEVGKGTKFTIKIPLDWHIKSGVAS